MERDPSVFIYGIGVPDHKKIFGSGVGEKIEDLQEFNAKIFSENLLSII